MILDAETLALAPGVEPLVAWAEGRELPGVLKMELLASMVELATDVARVGRRRRSSRAARAARRRGRGRRADGLAIAAAGTHAVQPPDGAADRARPALPRVRPVRRRLGEAPGRLRAARPCRHAGRRGVHARARGRPAVAAGRARALGELAVPRRRGDGPVLERAPRCSRSCRARRAAGLRARTPSGRRSSSASCGSALRTATRASGGTSGRTRGSGRSRCARPTSRPTSS